MTSTVLVDTPVLLSWSSEPERMSRAADAILSEADEVAVASITWFELAWLAHHERITVTVPVRSWLHQLGAQVRTVGVTPAIADTAVSLPSSFPGDPADRLIYATAIEHGWKLVTKDRKLLGHGHGRPLAVW
ncbi:MAG: type II toxin-antitoxin system VapC family toxin [Actinomycetota bacterium]|nr:type II toxin-antitoxin system VapC family toxin [Actinomycetota bacterium]